MPDASPPDAFILLRVSFPGQEDERTPTAAAAAAVSPLVYRYEAYAAVTPRGLSNGRFHRRRKTQASGASEKSDE